MFAMYVWYTKGQQPAFKQFLFKDSRAIAADFLQDKLKCLYMFICRKGDMGIQNCFTIH